MSSSLQAEQPKSGSPFSWPGLGGETSSVGWLQREQTPRQPRLFRASTAFWDTFPRQPRCGTGSGCSSAWSDAVSSLKSAKAGSGTREKWFIGGRESWHEHWVRGLGWNKVPPEVLLRLWCSWNRAPLFSVCKKLPCGVFVWVVKICLTQRADNEHLGAKPPLWKSFCCSSALASPANL